MKLKEFRRRLDEACNKSGVDELDCDFEINIDNRIFSVASVTLLGILPRIEMQVGDLIFDPDIHINKEAY